MTTIQRLELVQWSRSWPSVETDTIIDFLTWWPFAILNFYVNFSHDLLVRANFRRDRLMFAEILRLFNFQYGDRGLCSVADVRNSRWRIAAILKSIICNICANERRTTGRTKTQIATTNCAKSQNYTFLKVDHLQYPRNLFLWNDLKAENLSINLYSLVRLVRRTGKTRTENIRKDGVTFATQCHFVDGEYLDK